MMRLNKGIPLPFGAIHNQRSLLALDNLVDFIALCANRERSSKAVNEVLFWFDGLIFQLRIKNWDMLTKAC